MSSSHLNLVSLGDTSLVAANVQGVAHIEQHVNSVVTHGSLLARVNAERGRENKERKMGIQRRRQ